MAEDVQTIVDFSQDISNAEPPLPIPIGEYVANIEAAQVKVSQNGNKYCEVRFRIPVDQYPVDYPVEEEPDGVMLVFRRLSAEDDKRSRARLRKFCEAINAPTGTTLDLSDWVGLTGRVVVQHSEWEGEDRAEIIRVEKDD